LKLHIKQEIETLNLFIIKIARKIKLNHIT